MSPEKYHLTRAEIDALDGTNKTHFLNENAKRVNKSLGDMTGITGFGFHIIEVAPGFETTEYHKHHHEDECVYVLEGSATAQIGEESVSIGPGDFIGYRKGGLAHTITNTGTEVLRCIVVGERAAFDIGDYPRLNKRIIRDKNVGWSLVDHADIDNLGGNVGKK